MSAKNLFLVWAACCIAASIKPVMVGNFQQAFMLLGMGWMMYHAAKIRHE